MLHLMVRVGDLERSSKFYAEAFGMQVLRESVNEAYKYTLKFVGPGREEEVVWELIIILISSEYRI
jgi:lactoylglutathione lyase